MKKWLLSILCLVLAFVCSGGLYDIYVAQASVIDLGNYKATVSQETIFNGKTSRVPFRINDIPREVGTNDPYQISGSVPWNMTEGFVSLKRAGEEIALKDCGLIPIKQSRADDENNNHVNLYIEGKNFVENYKRTEGDVWTIGGTWEGAGYKLTIEPFVFVIGANGGYSNDGCIQEYRPKEEHTGFRVLSGASLRFDFEQGKSGIRFRAEIGKDFDRDTAYYMMIVPKAYIDKYQITENFYANLMTALQKDGRSDFIANMACKPIQFSETEIKESNGVLKEDYWYVQGALTNIKYENINSKFFAIAYYIDKAGEYQYASFQKGENERSLSHIAGIAVGTGEYEGEELNLLEEYVAMGKALDAGLSQEEYEASKNK